MDVKGFILRFFALIGLIVPFLAGIAVWTVWQSGIAPFATEEKAEALPESIVLNFDLREPLVEQTQGFSLPLPSLSSGGGEPFFPLVIALKRAQKDSRVKSVVVRLGAHAPSFAHAQEVATAVAALRKTGKATYVFAPSYGDFGPGLAMYYFASQFENVWLQPVGSVGLTGLGMEAPFAKTALENVGVKADFLRRKDYKSVMENVTEDAFSPSVKRNMQEMLDDLTDQAALGIATGRGVPVEKARAFLEQGPYTTKEALASGLVTRIGYEDEMLDEAKAKGGKEAKLVDFSAYLDGTDMEEDEETKADVALIYAQGVIVDAAPKGPYGALEDDVIDADSLVEAFQDAAQDKDVKAILFRVDSPGGSPVASETIRRAVVLAKKSEKPVIVSMGRVAASGGYWIAMDGSHIIADPATITGSIGVVAGKFVLGKLFDKLGVRWESLKTSENADMWSSREMFSVHARARMDAMIDETYETFLANVSAARKIPMEKMEDVAGGRVFTGRQALAVGLVDELGGMDEAVAAIKKSLKLAQDDKISLIPFPKPESPREMVLDILREFLSSMVLLRDFASQASALKTPLNSLRSILGQDAALTRLLPAYVAP